MISIYLSRYLWIIMELTIFRLTKSRMQQTIRLMPGIINWAMESRSLAKRITLAVRQSARTSREISIGIPTRNSSSNVANTNIPAIPLIK